MANPTILALCPCCKIIAPDDVRALLQDGLIGGWFPLRCSWCAAPVQLWLAGAEIVLMERLGRWLEEERGLAWQVRFPPGTRYVYVLPTPSWGEAKRKRRWLLGLIGEFDPEDVTCSEISGTHVVWPVAARCGSNALDPSDDVVLIDTGR